MKIIISVIWVLIGFISWWLVYHGLLKKWYKDNKESYWKFDKENNGNSAIKWWVIVCPIIVFGGLFSFIFLKGLNLSMSIWFTTKNRQTKNYDN